MSEEFELPPQTVQRRCVFYVPGFDPMPPNRYRELYRAEAAKQAEISGFEIEAKRISTRDGISRFETKSVMNDQKVTTEFRFLGWNDLVHQEMNGPIYKSWIGLLKVAKVIGFSGSLGRLLKLHFPPNIAGLYPFFMITFQILFSLFLAIAVGTALAEIDIPGVSFLAWAIGIFLFIASVKLWRKLDDHLMAYYMLHDLMFICQQGGYTPKALRERLEKFKETILDAENDDFDEILVVGHSSGAHLAVIVLAELLREGHISENKEISLLTLGHAIPLVSYLPTACDLRLALRELSSQTKIKWVDITAPSDGACFALHNPVTSSIEVDQSSPMPRVLSAAFRQTLSNDYYRSLRLRFFRLHFQYLCHFDKPATYDYFRVTAGPITLWERYGESNNTPSLLSGNFNKFVNEAP